MSTTKQKEAFKQHFKDVEVKDFSTLGTMKKIEVENYRKSVIDGMEGMFAICEKENRNFNDTEELAFREAEELISSVDSALDAQERREKIKEYKSISFPKKYESRPDVEEDKYSYRSLHHKHIDTEDNKGFRSLQEFMQKCFEVVSHRTIDPRLNECRDTALEKDGVTGGFAVPAAFNPSLMDTPGRQEIVRPNGAQVMGQVYPVQTFPIFDESDLSTGYAGGLKTERVAEAGTYQEKTAKLIEVTLTARKFGYLVKLSEELYADAPPLIARIPQKMGQAVRGGADAHFISGNGVQEPKGVLNSGAAVTVNRATANQIAYGDVVNMWARFFGDGFTNPVFVANRSTIPQLANLRDTGNNNLWIESMGVSIPQNIFGAPLIISNRVPSLGTKGDLLLCDFSCYVIGMRSELVVRFSEHAFFDEGVVAFRIYSRYDGATYLNSPITPEDSGATQSPIVILDTP